MLEYTDASYEVSYEMPTVYSIAPRSNPELSKTVTLCQQRQARPATGGNTADRIGKVKKHASQPAIHSNVSVNYGH